MRSRRVLLFAFVFMLAALPVMAFDDVPESDPFQGDIEWLADSGITRGCNPPENTRFCPGDSVTRGAMAAFLVRALDLEPSEESFADTAGHVFEQDIAALAAAGITRGCNPPDNTRFCPDQPVTRAQMAAFLHRALRTDGPGAGPGTLYFEFAGDAYAADLDALAGREYPTDFPVFNGETPTSVNVTANEYIHYDDPLNAPSRVFVHDLATLVQKQAVTWPQGRLCVGAPLGSPDGRLLVGESDCLDEHRVSVVDRTRSGADSLLVSLDGNAVVGWRWTPDNDLLLVQVTDWSEGTIPDPTAWAIAEVSNADLLARPAQIPVQELRHFSTSEGEPTLLDVSPDGTEILVSVGNTIHVMDRGTGASLHQLTSGAHPHSRGVFAPDGSAIAFVNLSEAGAFGTRFGQVHIIPNHRGQPIQIRENGPTMPVTGGGDSIQADGVLGWGS